jgi:hypothetical protein
MKKKLVIVQSNLCWKIHNKYIFHVNIHIVVLKYLVQKQIIQNQFKISEGGKWNSHHDYFKIVINYCNIQNVCVLLRMCIISCFVIIVRSSFIYKENVYQNQLHNNVKTITVPLK